MTTPVLIPLQHLDGFNVWISNDLAGTCWQDRTGHRWYVRWTPPARFIFGTTDNFPDAIKMISDNYHD